VIAPLTFVLPELCSENKSSTFNKRLPPSCELGSLYIDPWGRTYMQPLIEYSLQITLQFRLPGETAVRATSAKHKIRVTAAPHFEPPAYSESILTSRAAAASADLRRSRLQSSVLSWLSLRLLLRVMLAESVSRQASFG
jgi:hypothetical protein